MYFIYVSFFSIWFLGGCPYEDRMKKIGLYKNSFYSCISSENYKVLSYLTISFFRNVVRVLFYNFACIIFSFLDIKFSLLVYLNCKKKKVSHSNENAADFKIRFFVTLQCHELHGFL